MERDADRKRLSVATAYRFVDEMGRVRRRGFRHVVGDLPRHDRPLRSTSRVGGRTRIHSRFGVVRHPSKLEEVRESRDRPRGLVSLASWQPCCSGRADRARQGAAVHVGGGPSAGLGRRRAPVRLVGVLGITRQPGSRVRRSRGRPCPPARTGLRCAAVAPVRWDGVTRRQVPRSTSGIGSRRLPRRREDRRAAGSR